MKKFPTYTGALLLTASIANAQAAKVAMRPLGNVEASTTDTILSIAGVRHLPNGNVLLNDQARHRIVLLDKDLKFVKLVADSTSTTNNAYGVGRGGMFAWRGDSTVFVDPIGLSMLVIDAQGNIVRTMAAPRPNDLQFMTNAAFGRPGLDGKGRLIYRQVDFGFGRGGPGAIRMSGGGGGIPQMPTPPDSSAIVRFDFATRKLDTVTFFKIPKINMSVTQDENGGIRMQSRVNPAPVVDEWAVMSNGSVAVVRGRDYHVDYFDVDGKVTRAEKLPYDWFRMDDDYKQKFLDSTKTVMDSLRKLAQTNPQAAATAGMAAAGLGGGGNGAPMMVFQMRGGDGPPPPRRDGGGDAGRGGNTEVRTTAGPGGFNMPAIEMVPPSDLPDYKPAFGTASVLSDADGRVWVRTIATKPNMGVIYDVIDASGKLIDRVQVPGTQTIAGFGQGGVVYLGFRDAAGIHLQKVTLKM
jgi:hypothetical protein